MRAHLDQDHRYRHSVRVARCADLLAQRHGLDAGKARLAGMLHDLARLFPESRLLTECRARGMPIDDFERANPTVLHARLGAALAREAFGVADPAVLSAIAKHTTAAGTMSALDCAVYLADSLEPGRNFEGRDELWRLATRDLRAGMRAALLHVTAHLAKKRTPIAPQTFAAARAFGLELEEVSAFAT